MNICFFNKSENRFTKKVNYIAELFFSTYGLEYDIIYSLDQLTDEDYRRPDLIMFYGTQEDYQILKKQTPFTCHLIFVSQLINQVFETNPPQVKILKQKGTDYSIPILFALPGTEQESSYTVEEKSGKQYAGISIKNNNGKMEITSYVDFFASSFYLLTLQEEKGAERFFAKGSWREKEGLHQMPLVNHYFKILFDLICLVAKEGRMPLLWKSFWPSGANMAVALTHDVDILAQWCLYIIFRKWTLLKKGDFKALMKMISKLPGFFFRKNKSSYGVDLLLDEEKSRGFNSTFFFLAGKPSWKTIIQSDITYSMKKAESPVRKILSNNGEIGLHGSRKSYLSQEGMRLEKENIDRFLPHPSMGVRQHFLHLKQPDTWRFQNRIGFIYDCSLGYPDRSGFRSGFAFPFKPFDMERDEEVPIWELNTNVMDQTYDKYDPKNIEQIKKEIYHLFKQVESTGGGLITLLWHTNVLEEFGFTGFLKLYAEVLDELKREKTFVSTGENIASFWKARREVRIKEVKAEKNLWQWEFQAGSPVEGLTFSMSRPYEGKFRIKVEGVKASVEINQSRALITFPRLEQNQNFKIILTSEGA
ncbi:MAG: polysaccharide deacetylase family protein [Candidatus Zixiibacteriota bacterium]